MTLIRASIYMSLILKRLLFLSFQLTWLQQQGGATIGFCLAWYESQTVKRQQQGLCHCWIPGHSEPRQMAENTTLATSTLIRSWLMDSTFVRRRGQPLKMIFCLPWEWSIVRMLSSIVTAVKSMTFGGARIDHTQDKMLLSPLAPSKW